MYLEGHSAESVGVEFGVSTATITSEVRLAGGEVRSAGNRNFKFTSRQIKRILRMYDGGFGVSMSGIARALGCSPPTIRRVLMENEALNPNAPSKRKVVFTTEQTSYIVQAHGSGRSANSLSKEFECSDSTILGLLRRNGVDTSGYGRGDRRRLVSCRDRWRTVRSLSRVMYKRYKHHINPKNLSISAKGHHVDHRYSVAQGLQDDLTVLDLAHPSNLQVLTCLDNLSKHYSSSIGRQQLLNEIKEWNKNNGDPFATVKMEVKYEYRYGRYRYFGGSYRHFRR